MASLNRHIQLKTESGAIRRVGYELEFAGLDLETVAHVVASAVDGEAVFLSKAQWEVKASSGTYAVELDAELVKSLAKRRAEASPGADDQLGDLLATIARQVVPAEVVCPPIALDHMAQLDRLVDALRDAGARGTDESVLYAFGLHINAEAASEKPAYLARMLKAFCLAQDWLQQAHGVDVSRRITPYIALFGKPYVECVLDYDGQVAMDKLITDYQQHNASRNRALDMLPLFMHLAADRVKQAIDDPRIQARPAFHYRLPNCEIDRADWQLDIEWRRWCVVEVLAQDDQLMSTLSDQWRAYHHSINPFQEAKWHQELDRIHARLSA